MSVYYFDIRDYKGFYLDEFGDDCEDLDEAIAQAQCILPAFARDGMPDSDHHEMICEVRDDSRRVVYRGELNYRGTHLTA